MTEPPSPPPGWYVDPTGKPQQRYFDGKNWGEEVKPLPPPVRPLTPAPVAAKDPGRAGPLFVTLIVLIGVGFFGGCFALLASHHSGNSSSAPTEQEIEASVIDTCEGSVKKQLKDPDSAKFGDDWKAWIVTNYNKPPPVPFHPENGDKYYNAAGTVNAKNSFGGYVGDQGYACDASVTTSGDVHAHAYSINDVLNPPS